MGWIMRIVFLDFDGVLNSLPWLGARAGEGWQGAGEARALNPENIAHLNRIVSVTSARVVISSSWRHGRPLACLAEMLVERGFQGTVLGRTPDHVPCMDPLSKRMHGCRGDEIQAWLGRAEEYGLYVDSFVVLDDGGDMGPVADRLVRTSLDEGLTAAHADRAIQMLLEPRPLLVIPSPAYRPEGS